MKCLNLNAPKVLLVISCLVLFVWLGQWLNHDELPTTVAPVVKVATATESKTASRSSEPPSDPAASATETPSGPVNLFGIRTWEPPPPPPPKPEPPPPPQAPPLPFKFIGRITGDGKAADFMLTRDDRVISAHVGDVIDDQYLFEKAENGQLVFLYRPLNQRQTLAVAAPPWNTP